MAERSTTLLLTRPLEAAQRFAARLTPDLPEDVRVLLSPLIDIVPTGRVPDLTDAAGVIFTSANGVRHAGDPAKLPAYCVGEKTAEFARAKGWDAASVGSTADALLQALIREKPLGPLMHIAGTHRRGDVAQRLSGAGVETTEIEVYDQKAHPLSDAAQTTLSGTGTVVVPLMSPRTAALFSRNTGDRAGLHLVAMSAAVVEELPNFPLAQISVAPFPDMENMALATLRALGRVEDRGASH